MKGWKQKYLLKSCVYACMCVCEHARVRTYVFLPSDWNAVSQYVRASNPVILLLQPLVRIRRDLWVLLIKWRACICRLLGKGNWRGPWKKNNRYTMIAQAEEGS